MLVTITLTHVAIGVALSIVSAFVSVWLAFVRPAHAKEVKLQVRLALLDSAMEKGADRMTRLEAKDGEILDLLRSIDTRLRNLETQFAGVAPALTRESQ